MRQLTLAIVALPLCLAHATVGFADEGDAKMFTWKRGQPAQVIGDVTNDLCLVTQVAGKFSDAGELVKLYQENGKWMLGGTSGQSELLISATCIKKTWMPRFASAPKYLKSGVNTPFVATTCQNKTLPLFGGRQRAYFLSAMSGRFRGDGESISVGMTANLNNVVRARACSGYAAAGAMYYEMHSKKPVAYVGTKGVPLIGAGVDRHVVAAGPSSPSESIIDTVVKYLPYPRGIDTNGNFDPRSHTSTLLTPVARGICGLTSVSGKFLGYGESVGIFAEKQSDGTMWWVLHGDIQAEDNWVWGGAKCLSRDQPYPT